MILFTFSVTICDAIKRYIDGLFYDLTHGHPFSDWVCEVEFENAILALVSSVQISEERLRDYFEAQMDTLLAQRCQKPSIISITAYRDRTNAVKQEDRLLRQVLEKARSVSLDVLAGGGGHRSGATIGSSGRSTSSPLLSTMPRLFPMPTPVWWAPYS